jgi:acetolactate synthase-1/2/3 large subunit
VVLAGVPCDFRLDYGRHIGVRARIVALSRNKDELGKNRHPSIAVAVDADLVLAGVARRLAPQAADLGRRWAAWAATLRERDEGRDREIADRAVQPGTHVNPLAFFNTLEALLPDRAVIVADGGDFVATGSYVLRPRGPLSWLDPGVFGTLGVGGGFALGANAARPDAETWVIWGDGAAAYSLAELDTCVRHRVPIIAVVGNDASWAQIAREQVEILGDATGTELRHSDYHTVADGLGAKGLLLDRQAATEDVLRAAQRLARAGHPVLVNVILDRTDFRKGSISM